MIQLVLRDLIFSRKAIDVTLLRKMPGTGGLTHPALTVFPYLVPFQFLLFHFVSDDLK